MIYVSIYGRLGNQMFQYAFARSLQEKRKKMGYSDSLVLCFSGVWEAAQNAALKDAVTYKNQLIHFYTRDYQQISDSMHPYGDNGEVHRAFIQKVIMRLWGKYSARQMVYHAEEQTHEKRWQWLLNFFGLIYYSSGFYPFKISKRWKTILCRGTFECERYFQDIREELRKEFMVRDEICDWNRLVYERIQREESVCLAVRCGDFINNEKNRQLYYVCNPDYYEEAVSRICQKIECPVFYVFSDDIPWVKENIKLPTDTVYEDVRNPVWETFRLMCACKHFIISNSTLHWWAQYLGTAKNKLVYAPGKWRVSGSRLDIMQDTWEEIEV